MRKILLVLFVVLLATFAWADREISGTIVSNTLYIPGTTTEMEFVLDFTSPDVEWVAFMELTFPAGMTPVGTPADIGTFLFNQIDGQTVSWGAGFGDTSMGYLSGTASPHVFSFEVQIDGDVTGDQTMSYHCYGDDYGAEPHEFTGDCVMSPALASDLVAVSVTGNPTPTDGMLETYQVTVNNQGQNAAAAFDVELFEGAGNSVAVYNATDLAAGATGVYDIDFTPAATGASVLYATVTWADDMNNANDMTPELTIDVQASGTAVVTIGEGTDTGNTLPLNYYWKNSLTEQIYYASELQIGGVLTAIDFFYTFVDVPAVSDFKIWVGETTNTDLSAGYIPASELTMVYDGTNDYVVGEGTLHITFDSPYAYGGGNLVVLANRPLDTEYYGSGDHFYYSIDEVNVARSLNKQSDTDEFDPNEAYTDGTMSGNYANAAFYFQTEGMGSITGNVTSEGTPVADAMVVIDGTPSATTTNATGDFTFPYVSEGTVSLTASKYGLMDATVTDVAVVEDETTVADIVMAPLPMVMVSGNVYGSDFPTVGIADAAVSLVGYDNYDVVTDADGMFSFPAVFANNDYELSISASGYSAYMATITVADVNLVLDDITVLEVAAPASAVLATPNADLSSVEVTWEAPGSGVASFSDDFESGSFDLWSEVIQGGGTPGEGAAAYWSVGDPDQEYDGLCARVDWGYTIDTWLITEPISVTSETVVSMDWNSSYHWSVDPNDNCDLFVKVSTDGGNTWNTVWTFGEIDPWENFVWYTSNITLDDYVGQAVNIAFNCVGDDNANVMMDNVSIGASSRAIGTYALSSTPKVQDTAKYSSSAVMNSTPSDVRAGVTFQASAITSTDRALETYKVYRLLEEDQGTPENWTMLAEDLTVMNHTDADFATVADGVYKYAVVAVYTNDNEAAASFSNPVEKGVSGTVTFIVVGNDGNAVEDASITFTATDGDPEHVYEATTDVAGNAIIDDVWFATYDLDVTAAGYVAFEDTDIAFTDDATINVTLNEVTNAPSNLTVDEVGDNTATIMWEEPGAGAAAEFRYDDGIATGQLGFGANPSSVLGGVHYHNAIISEVTWLLTSNAAHTEAVVYIFGLDGAGVPDTAQLLHESSPQPNVDDAWNTYTLDTPIEAPNGFFVGMCTPGIFTALGTDDGVDEPYVFQEGTQMGIADWTAGNDWLDVGPAGFPNNFTVRAFGMDLGELRFAPREPLTGNGSEELVYSRLETPIASTTNTRSLTGYNVYLDGTFVATTGADEMIYAFTGLDLGTVYEAGVTAVYTGDIESDMITVELTTTEDGGDIAPAVTTKLGVNYPNPFNPSTNIRFSLKNTEKVSVQVYNIKGELVNTLINGTLDAGTHNVVWEGYDKAERPCASGVYFYKMKAGRYTSTKKMILMK